MNAIVRPFRDEDYEPVLEACLLAFTPIFDGFEEQLGPEIFRIRYPRWQTDYETHLKTYSQARPGREVFVVEDKGAIAGFIELEFDAATRIAELGLNAVHPNHQGRGIGKQMYRFALKHFRDAGAQMVYVSTGADEAHAPARAAYHGVGFGRSLPSITYFMQV